jgi:hypothetical protein
MLIPNMNFVWAARPLESGFLENWLSTEKILFYRKIVLIPPDCRGDRTVYETLIFSVPKRFLKNKETNFSFPPAKIGGNRKIHISV